MGRTSSFPEITETSSTKLLNSDTVLRLHQDSKSQ